MKSIAMATAAMLLVAAGATAGELAVSNSTLDNMGLGSMERMSDDAGLAVRGKGAAVWGGSTAAWAPPAQNGGKHSFQWMQPDNIAESGNFYEAGGPSSAAGGSLSFAGQFAVEFWADPTGFTLGVAAAGVVAGGGAFAANM